MAKQRIEIGEAVNDKRGDPLRTAFGKVNNNFDELYALIGGASVDLAELAQDYAATLFTHANHTNITATYDDANNKVLLTGAASAVWPVANTNNEFGPTRIAIGNSAGNIAQGAATVAVGSFAGNDTQGGASVAIGTYAGTTTQRNDAIAIGYLTGNDVQGTGAVSIGRQAGQTSQGAYSIAIGKLAGQTSQAANTIILNAANAPLNGVSAQTNSFYVNPIRTDATPSNVLFYNTTTKEVTYGSAPSVTVSSLVNSSKTVSLDSNSNLTFTNGEQIKTNFLGGGIELYRSSDNTIGIYSGGAEIKTFATGGAKHTWDFGTDGSLIFPDDLTIDSGVIGKSSTETLTEEVPGGTASSTTTIESQIEIETTGIVIAKRIILTDNDTVTTTTNEVGFTLTVNDSTASLKHYVEPEGPDNSMYFQVSTTNAGATLEGVVETLNGTDYGRVVATQNAVTVNTSSDGVNKYWLFDYLGGLTLPTPTSQVFTLTFDASHYTPTIGKPSLTLTDEPWELEGQVVYEHDGTAALQLTNIWPNLVNPGYSSGDSFTFSTLVHGLSDYTLTITLNDVVLPGGAGWTANVAASALPDYPSSILANGAIKLTADTESFIFGADGNLHFPDGSFQGTAFIGTGNIEFRNDSINDINGILITNASQTVASTASISIPANTGGNITINNVEESTESNAIDVVTDFTAYVTLVDGITTIRDWSQRNSEQIEVNLFVAFATPAYNLLTDLALGRAVVVSYLDNAGDPQTFTSVVSQQFTNIGQGDPSNNWVRVSGRIDGTLPADVNNLALSISGVDFPVDITTNRNWTFATNGQLTVPGAIRKDGGLYMNSGGDGISSTVFVNGTAGSVILRTDNGTSNKSLTFDVDGKLIFPDNLTVANGIIGKASTDTVTEGNESETTEIESQVEIDTANIVIARRTSITYTDGIITTVNNIGSELEVNNDRATLKFYTEPDGPDNNEYAQFTTYGGATIESVIEDAGGTTAYGRVRAGGNAVQLFAKTFLGTEKYWAFNSEGNLVLPEGGDIESVGANYDDFAEIETSYNDAEEAYQGELMNWMLLESFRPVWYALPGRLAYDEMSAWTPTTGQPDLPPTLIPLASDARDIYNTWQTTIALSKITVSSGEADFDFNSTGKLKVSQGGTIGGGDQAAIDAAYAEWQSEDAAWQTIITSEGTDVRPRPWTFAGPSRVERQTVLTAMWEAQQSGDNIDWEPISAAFYNQVRTWLDITVNQDGYEKWKKLTTSVNITSEDKNWTFTNDGGTTFPGKLHGVVEIDPETETQTGHTLSIAPAGDYTSKSFNFRVDQYQGPGSFTRAFLDMPTAEINKSVAIAFPLANSGSGSIFNQGNNTNGLGMNNAFNIFRNGGDVKITAQASSGGFDLYTWKFGNNGDLTLPKGAVINETASSPGLLKKKYSGTFVLDPTWFVTNAGNLVETSTVSTIQSTDLEVFGAFSFEFTGYFVPPTSANYTFKAHADETFVFWIGDKALSGYTYANKDMYGDFNGTFTEQQTQSFTIALTAGQFYPIRIQWGNSAGWGVLDVFTWANDVEQADTSNFSGHIYTADTGTAKISVNDNKSIILSTNNDILNNWTFAADGILTLPGEIEATIGNDVSIGTTSLLPTDPPTTITITGADLASVNLVYTRAEELTPPRWRSPMNNPSTDPYIEFDNGEYGIFDPDYSFDPIYVNTGTFNIPLTQWSLNPAVDRTVPPTGVYTYPAAIYTHSWSFGADGNITLPNNSIIKDTAGDAIAFGRDAGITSQGLGAIAIGYQAGNIGQWQGSVALGEAAGTAYQGRGAVALGERSGQYRQGTNAIAIGRYAGQDEQHANSIILNASGATFNSDGANRFYVNPIRSDATPTSVLLYNATSKEVTYGANPKTQGTFTLGLGMNGITITLDVNATYTMWLRAVVDNGVISYNATFTITNANLPVLGQQQAYAYTGAGTPLDWVSLPTQIINTAGGVTRNGTLIGPLPANVFDFVIQNDSEQEVVLHYGYTKV
jgi:hypothetical protein